MKKKRIITITMDIDMETHLSETKLEIIQDGVTPDNFTVAEALSISSVLGHFGQQFLDRVREMAVKEEMRDEKDLRNNQK